ncbi:uncharacterized protein LOC143542761 [Bidens hawaiensis]|uniref:uncharacterized protein LOC143542761 n=1 Tax=Bidens hawaiensis TaxID=980011 RepID=UPI00404B2E10
MMLFIATMVECSGNGKCLKAFLPCFSKEFDFKRIDWCEVIYRSLRECTDKWKRDERKAYFLGPLTILSLYYVDTVTSDNIPHTLFNLGISGWTLDKLKERQSIEMAGGGFGLFTIEEVGVTGCKRSGKAKDKRKASKSINKSHVKDKLKRMGDVLDMITNARMSLRK